VPKSPAVRRYLRRFFPLMSAYVVGLFAANHLADAAERSAGTLALLSLLPTLPLLGVILVMGLYVAEERDEYVRHRIVVAMLGATALLLAMATAWGFLEGFDVVPHAPVFLAFPIWCAGLGVSQGAMALRDRFAGESA
jgi:hypothetical protein